MKKHEAIEIERKYLVTGIPTDAMQRAGTFIEQGYMAVSQMVTGAG